MEEEKTPKSKLVLDINTITDEETLKIPTLHNAAKIFKVTSKTIVEILSNKGSILEDNCFTRLTKNEYDKLVERFERGNIIDSLNLIKIVEDEEIYFVDIECNRVDILPLELLIQMQEQKENDNQTFDFYLNKIGEIYKITIKIKNDGWQSPYFYTGVLNYEGKIILPINKNQFIGYIETLSLIYVEDDNEIYFLNDVGKRLDTLPINLILNQKIGKDNFNLVKYCDNFSIIIGKFNGVLNNKGRIILPIKCKQRVYLFETISIIIVCEESEIYFLDSEGNRVNKLPNEFIDKFLNVNERNTTTIYDQKIYWEIERHDLLVSCSGIFLYKEGDLYIFGIANKNRITYEGVISKDGKIILPIKYKKIIIDIHNQHIRIGYNQYNHINTIFDFNGNVLLENFIEIGPFSDGYAVVLERFVEDDDNLYWGVMDEKLNIAPIQKKFTNYYYLGGGYNKIEDFKKGFAKAYIYNQTTGLPDMFDIINTNGEVILESVHDFQITDSYIITINRMLKERYCGFDFGFETVGWYNTIYNHSGEHLFTLKASDHFIYPEGFKVEDLHKAEKYIQNESKRKYGFVDSNFKIIIPIIYDKVGLIVNDISIVKLNEKYGVIDKQGRLIIAPQYDSISRFGDDLLKVNIGGQITLNSIKKKVVEGGLNALLTFNGILITPLIYEKIFLTNNSNYFKVLENGLYGIIDKTGKEIIPSKYNSVKQFKDEIFAVNIGGGLIDNLNKRNHSNSRLQNEKVFSGGKWHFVNSSNIKIGKLEFDEVRDFQEGFASVKIGSKYGFIDTLGKMVISPQFDNSRSFQNGLAAVMLENKYGFINTKGEIIIPPQFDKVDNFSKIDHYEGGERELYSEVKIGELYNEINTDGVITKKWSKLSNYAKCMSDCCSNDYDDYSNSNNSDNPWIDVYGPGEEADTAYWNTD